MSIDHEPVVEVVDDPVRFAALEPEWNELLADSAAGCPFLTWDWLHAWWTHLGGDRRLSIVIVRQEGRLIAIAPLSLSRARLPWFWQWEFLGTGFAGSDYLDLIARRGYENAGIRGIDQTLRSKRLALHLEHLPPDSLASRLTPALTESAWICHTISRGICPFISLDGHDWDSYLASVGPAHRANVRRRLRALARDFDMQFELTLNEDQRRTALESLFTYHDQRWQNRGGSSAFQTGPLRAFHHDATRRALARGWLRLYTLKLNGDVAAVMYGFLFHNRFYFYQHGFDEHYSPYSIGCALMAMTIQAALGEAAHEFDMLYGDEKYKSLWTHERRSLARIDLFPPHLPGRLHRRSVEAEQTLRTLARRVLAFNHAS